MAKLTVDQKLMLDAIQMGEAGAVQELTAPPGWFAKLRVDVDENIADTKQTYLMAAMASPKSAQTIEAIIDARKDKSADGFKKFVQARDSQGDTAFMYAALHNNSEAVDKLIEAARNNGVASNMANLGLQIENNNGHNVLDIAISQKNAHMVKALLDAGAPTENHTKLMVNAVNTGDKLTAAVLLKHKPEIAMALLDDGEGGHYNALQYAIQNDKLHMVKAIRDAVGEEKYAALLSQNNGKYGTALDTAQQSDYAHTDTLVAGTEHEEKYKLAAAQASTEKAAAAVVKTTAPEKAQTAAQESKGQTKESPAQETASAPSPRAQSAQPQGHQPQTLAGKILKSLDTNHDGVLSRDEFNALGKEGKAQLAKAMDTNGGGVDAGERKRALVDSGLDVNSNKIKDSHGKVGKTAEERLEIAAANFGKAMRNAGAPMSYGTTTKVAPTLTASNSMPGQHHPGGHSKA